MFNAMKVFALMALFLIAGYSGRAQLVSGTLQASGLTCSICSKAVKTALEKVSFVKHVDVNIKDQEYQISFREGDVTNLDELARAVEDAGFSISKLIVRAKAQESEWKKDAHFKMGTLQFHYLSNKTAALNDMVDFQIVDRSFVSAKEFRKYSQLTKMSCIQSGFMETCCNQDDGGGKKRIYHVVI